MRRTPLLAALAALALLAGCGDDDDPVADTTPVTATAPSPPATTPLPATTPSTATQDRATRTLEEPPAQERTGGVAAVPGALGATDNDALDAANAAIARACDARATGGSPSEDDLAVLEAGVDALLDVHRRHPDRVFVPPQRAERSRPVTDVLREAADALRADGCDTAAADRLDAAAGG